MLLSAVLSTTMQNGEAVELEKLYTDCGLTAPESQQKTCIFWKNLFHFLFSESAI